MDEPPSEILNMHKSPSSLSNSPQPQLHQQQASTKNKKLFPRKLWDLINDEKYNFCLRWSDDGQLVYLNRDEFEDSYLKTQENQFHTQKAISFVRQMNMYGFRKVDDCYYENDSFKRDCEHLLKNMIRKHPNKSQNHSELSNLLYHENSPANLQATGATASLLTPMPPNYIRDCRQLFNTSICESNKPQDNIKFELNNFAQSHCNNNNNSRNNNNNLRRHRQVLDARLNEDSLSSSGDCCYNASSSQNETLDYLIDKNEAHNTDKMFDLAEMHHKQNAHHMNSLPSFAPSEPNSYYFPPTLNDDRQMLEASEANRASHNQVYNDFFMNHPTMANLMMNLRSATNSGSIDDPNVQQHNTQALYNVQKELFEALMAQQGDIHTPRDLTTTTPTSNHANIGSESSNLNAFNSLLTSINSHLYHQPLIMQSNQASNQNLPLDIGRLSSLQHIYQQILSEQQQQQQRRQPQHHDSSTKGVNYGIGDDTPHPQLASGAANEFSGSGNPVPSFRETSSTSLLVRNKGVSNTSSSYKSCSQLNEKCLAKKQGLDTLVNDNDARRRDIKTNRAFKRGLDSLLDDSASSPEKTQDKAKKIKIENSPENRPAEPTISSKTKKYATNLVLRVASDRDAHFDAEVLSAVSSYAQQFVEILFDTAQLIARHSSSSLLSGTSNDPQIGEDTSKIEKESNRANINLNDLTSALKLIPSKISNILK